MGSVSGSVVAECDTCACKFVWTLKDMPFVNSRIVGTCSKCINEESHECITELELDEKGCFRRLQKLLSQINIVLTSRTTEVARKLIPTQEGFFFGETGYDEYYWSELERTQVALTEELKNWDNDFTYYYHSSW